MREYESDLGCSQRKERLRVFIYDLKHRDLLLYACAGLQYESEAILIDGGRDGSDDVDYHWTHSDLIHSSLAGCVCGGWDIHN
jgi:hypothetical protein